jgi:amino-acid N-acetyltransferase
VADFAADSSQVTALETAMIIDISRKPSRSAAIALLEGAGLPTADLTDECLEQFFFFGPRAAPRGRVGLEFHGDDALLRSLVVAPDYRATQAGTALVAHIESHARAQGVTAIYLLTTTAEQYFTRLGYERTGRDHAPPAIRSTQEFSKICPAASVLMVKRL